MRTQVLKRENHLVIPIPDSWAFDSNITPGSVVDLSLVDGKLMVTPLSRSEYTLEDLLEGVTVQNRHEEVDTGHPVGREVW